MPATSVILTLRSGVPGVSANMSGALLSTSIRPSRASSSLLKSTLRVLIWRENSSSKRIVLILACVSEALEGSRKPSGVFEFLHQLPGANLLGLGKGLVGEEDGCVGNRLSVTSRTPAHVACA